jgi:hypothetical protein
MVAGEFRLVIGTDRVYLLVNTGENGFWAEILTGKEQGNNRRGNGENILTNRCRGPLN